MKSSSFNRQSYPEKIIDGMTADVGQRYLHDFVHEAGNAATAWFLFDLKTN